MAFSLRILNENFYERYIKMGFTEIGVILFLIALLVFGFINSRKVSQELKKLETDK